MQPPGKPFEILIREHETALVAYLRACGVGAAAEDIAQECFLAAWDHIDAYDPARPFAAWLRGIGKHKLLEHFRATADSRRHLEEHRRQQIDAIEREFGRLMPRRGDTQNEMFAALAACIAGLPDEQRELVRRAYHESQTCGAMAAAFNQNVEAIRKRLQRIRAELRDCILGKLRSEAGHA